MGRALGALAAKTGRKSFNGGFEIDVRAAAAQQIQHMLAQGWIVFHKSFRKTRAKRSAARSVAQWYRGARRTFALSVLSVSKTLSWSHGNGARLDHDVRLRSGFFPVGIGD